MKHTPTLEMQDGSGGVPPSWVHEEPSQYSKPVEDTHVAPLKDISFKFPNDGSFLQQFTMSQQDSAVEQTVEASTEHRSTETGESSESKSDDVNTPEPASTNQVPVDSKPKKSLLAAFSTKKKEAKPTAAAVPSGPETEEQTKKRKRDEYLAEMAKYRSSSCANSEGKHSLVK